MEKNSKTYEETEHIFERDEQVKDSEDNNPAQSAASSEEEPIRDEGLTPIDEAIDGEDDAQEESPHEQPGVLAQP